MEISKWGNAVWESDLPPLQASALAMLEPHLDEQTGRLMKSISAIKSEDIDDPEMADALDRALTSPWVIRHNGAIWARRPDQYSESAVVANQIGTPPSSAESVE